MNEIELYKKTDECIAKFKNGKERYKQSATFNRVIQMLVRDVDPYEIIDQLCQTIDDIQKAFNQYAFRGPANCAIFDVSQQRELLIDFCEVYADGKFEDPDDTEGIVDWYLRVKDN